MRSEFERYEQILRDQLSDHDRYDAILHRQVERREAEPKPTRKENRVEEQKPSIEVTFTPKAAPREAQTVARRATGAKEKLKELGEGYAPPSWVKEKAKYRDMWRHYKSEARKHGVSSDILDFDQELYADDLSEAEIKQKIHEKVALASAPRERKEELASEYEERMEIPVREYERIMRKIERIEEGA